MENTSLGNRQDHVFTRTGYLKYEYIITLLYPDFKFNLIKKISVEGYKGYTKVTLGATKNKMESYSYR